MNTASGAVYLLLGILEAMVSGVYRYLAGRDGEPSILDWLVSVTCFLCSLVHVHMGIERMKEERAARSGGEEACGEI